MAMHELRFGARLSESFIEMLKQAAAKATAEWPGVLPCLCIGETRQYEDAAQSAPSAERINFERIPDCAPINRLVPQREPPILVTERFWAVCFDKRRYTPQTTFLIDGLEVHVDEQAQSDLKGVTLDFVNGKIVAHYGGAPEKL
jgi:hypothetical protein